MAGFVRGRDPKNSKDTIDWSTVPLRGFRKFMVRDDYLTGVTYQLKWQPGVNDAMCALNATQPRPDAGWDEVILRTPPAGHTLHTCQCGFHAVYPQSRFDDYWGHVEGVVEGWGEVITGPLGFRAAKSKIVALTFATFVPPHAQAPAFDQEAIRRRYGVPTFASRDEMLAEFPSQRGEYPIEEEHEEVRPRPRRWSTSVGNSSGMTVYRGGGAVSGSQPLPRATGGGIGQAKTTYSIPAPQGSVAVGPRGVNYLVGCGCSSCTLAANGGS